MEAERLVMYNRHHLGLNVLEDRRVTGDHRVCLSSVEFERVHSASMLEFQKGGNPVVERAHHQVLDRLISV